MTLTLLALLAGVVPAGRGASPEPPAAPALKQAFTDAFLLGTAVNDDIVSGRDARAQALVPRHFNAITLENSMKAEVLNPRPGEYDFAAADAFVAFGEQHGMFIVGHTLVWHNQTPEWFFQQADGTPVWAHETIQPGQRLAHEYRVAGIHQPCEQAAHVSRATA